MNLPTLATVLVSLAFVGLCIWVMWPSNKARFERDALIPLQDDGHRATHKGPPK